MVEDMERVFVIDNKYASLSCSILSWKKQSATVRLQSKFLLSKWWTAQKTTKDQGISFHATEEEKGSINQTTW